MGRLVVVVSWVLMLAVSPGLAIAEETVPTSPTGEVTRSFTARAKSLKSGKLIYTVAYDEQWLGGVWTKRVMTASDLEGKVFLVRTLYPNSNFRTPKLEMVNERLNFRVGAERVGKKIHVSRSIRDAQPEKDIFDDDATLVIPGGLVAMMRSQWDALVAGKTASWRMVAPARLDWFTVRVRSEGIHIVGQREVMRFVMEPDSWLARLLVEELVFDLDTKTRALARYVGVGMYSRAGEEPEPIELLFDNELPNVSPAPLAGDRP